MYSLGKAHFEELHLRFDDFGKMIFCEHGEAGLIDVSAEIKASSRENWEFGEIQIGEQYAHSRSPLWKMIADHLEEKYLTKIHDHIDDNLPDARDEARYEARAFHMGW